MNILQPIKENFSDEIALLTTIQTKFPSAIIAGGAVRDLLLNRPRKDIDIFVHESDAEQSLLSASLLQDMLKDHLPDQLPTSDLNPFMPKSQSMNMATQRRAPIFRKCTSFTDDDIAANSVIVDVFGGTTSRNVDFDIIVTSCSPKTYVQEYFDIGLCKVFFDGKSWTCHSDFVDDYRNNTITVCGAHMGAQEITRSVTGHAKRVQAKYPNLTIALSPRNQKILDNAKPPTGLINPC